VAPAAAQTTPSTYTWNSTTSTDWLSAGNWSGTQTDFPGTTGNGSGNNAGDTAVFGSTMPAGFAVGIDMSNSNGSAKQLLQLGAITFSNTSNNLVIGNSSTQKTGTLQLNGATVTIGGTPTANVLLSNTSTSQTLTIQNTANGGNKTMDVALNVTNGVIHAASGSTITISSLVTETGGTRGFTLSGGGTLNLSGANTYTGATTVAGGTLSAINTAGSATGSGAVSVSTGARLAGTGTITPSAGNTIAVAGTVQPGTDTATGYLTLGSATSVTGTFAWSFSSSGTGSTTPPSSGASDTNNPANQSRLVVNGALTLAPTTFNVIGLTGLSFDNTKYYSWRIATATGTVTVGAQPTFNVTGLNTGGGTFTLSGGVGAGYLNFTPAPEPATILLLCGVATGAVVGVQRWRKRGSDICRLCLPRGESA